MNTKNKTYKHNQTQIRKALHAALKSRSLSLRPQDLCKSASITTATFYSHYRTIDAALHDYEHELQSEFTQAIPHLPKRSSIFASLLTFIYRNRSYFRATLSSHNYYLLNKILTDSRESFLHIKINPRTFLHYTSEIIHLIVSWCHFDNLSSHKIPAYVTKLTQLQVSHEHTSHQICKNPNL